MRLYLAGTVQHVGIGSRRAVHRQSVLRGAQNSATEAPKAAAKTCGAAGITKPRPAFARAALLSLAELKAMPPALIWKTITEDEFMTEARLAAESEPCGPRRRCRVCPTARFRGWERGDYTTALSIPSIKNILLFRRPKSGVC